MKGILSGLFALLLVVAPAAAHAEIIDRIVASVNGEIITLSEVNERVEQIMENPQAAGQDPRALKSQVLNMMVNQILTEQAAENMGVSVSEKEVEDAIGRIAESNDMTVSQLNQEIRGQGATMDEFKRDIRSDLIRRRIMKYDLGAHIVVTDEDIARFLREGGAAPTPQGFDPAAAADITGRVHLRHIFLPFESQPTEADARALFEEGQRIVDEIKGGMDFQSAARRYSKSPNAATGGDLGTMDVQEMDRNVRAVLAQLEPGQVSPPVVTGAGVQIFQIISKNTTQSAAAPRPQQTPESRPASTEAVSSLSPEERERIIQVIKERRLQNKFEDWINELRRKAIIEINL
jgi:peptidyl-prolyl cis-trans isomerase SurA